MGETQNQLFQLSFNASLRVDFQGSRVTSDGGLILIRELDERLGFGELIEQYLTDSRAQNARLLRQSVYSRLAGYEDVNDAAADLCAPGPHRLTRGECDEAGGRRKGPRVEWCPRNASVPGVPVAARDREPG